jgi:hypothetical protein
MFPAPSSWSDQHRDWTRRAFLDVQNGIGGHTGMNCRVAAGTIPDVTRSAMRNIHSELRALVQRRRCSRRACELSIPIDSTFIKIHLRQTLAHTTFYGRAATITFPAILGKNSSPIRTASFDSPS